MIIQELLDDTFVRTYSNTGMLIYGGYPAGNYAEAIDPISANRTYVETDIPIEGWEAPEKMIAANNIPSGQYFISDSKLYYSTKSIVAGEEIKPGVNCEETDIANELNNMKETE